MQRASRFRIRRHTDVLLPWQPISQRCPLQLRDRRAQLLHTGREYRLPWRGGVSLYFVSIHPDAGPDASADEPADPPTHGVANPPTDAGADAPAQPGPVAATVDHADAPAVAATDAPAFAAAHAPADLFALSPTEPRALRATQRGPNSSAVAGTCRTVYCTTNGSIRLENSCSEPLVCQRHLETSSLTMRRS